MELSLYSTPSLKVTYLLSKGYILTDKVAYFQVVTPLLNKAHK